MTIRYYYKIDYKDKILIDNINNSGVKTIFWDNNSKLWYSNNLYTQLQPYLYKQENEKPKPFYSYMETDTNRKRLSDIHTIPQLSQQVHESLIGVL